MVRNSPKVLARASCPGRKKIKGSKVLKILLLSCASALSLFCASVHAAEKLELTLKEAVDMSLKENLSLSQERINPKIAEGDIKFREGEFDPNIELKATNSYKKSPSASLLMGTEDRTTSGSLGLGGKVNTGTLYELKWTNERARSNSGYLITNPYYTSELVLSLTQPLLKGFGKDNQEANLNISKNSFEIAKLNLDDKTIQIISDTSNAYWDLVFARHDLEVAELSLKLAQNLLDEIKAKIAAGALAPVEIYKAEAEVSMREETLLKSKKLLLDSTDRLRVVMNLKDWLVELIPIGKIPEILDAQPVEYALDAAFKNRNDYKQALIDQKNKETLRKYFDNQQYPDLNIIGSVGLNGLNGNYNNALDKMSSGDYYSWQFGLSLKIPLGNRSAKGNFIKAKYEEEKTAIAVKILEQKITAGVREVFRSVQLASETINAAKKTRIATEKRLEAEEGRFKVGMATINDVLKFQEEYAKALSSEKRAEVDYAKAIVEFDRVKGTLGR